MDRPEPGLIKWSPNAAFDSFLHINLQHRVVHVYEPTGHAKNGSFQYKKLSQHDDFPPLTTYDWSPTVPGLLAVGTSAGIVNLLRTDDNSNAYLELNVKVARTCQAVAFSTRGMLAVGLDRVRTDQSLYVWDVNRLSTMGETPKGFPPNIAPFHEPSFRHESSLSVSSLKFFEDNPHTLAMGIKGQGLRIHDLRDPGTPTTFQTRCNNNLAIDYADPNYFASSALDQPGIMVWDRRATNRFLASPSYNSAVQDQQLLPWGGALWLEQALERESHEAMSDSKNSFIRSLRYCRDRRGMLAVLSRTGQLKVLETRPEILDEAFIVENSPELLEVRKSNEMDNYFSDQSKKSERIVSFDWVTTGTPVQLPRLLVLRANGVFEILEVPSFTKPYAYKLTPWQAPHRGLEAGGVHHDLVQFEPSQAAEILAPRMTEDELEDLPLFGEKKLDINAVVKTALENSIQEGAHLEDSDASTPPPLPESFTTATSVAERLRILRKYAQDLKAPPQHDANDVFGAAHKLSSLTVSEGRQNTNRERHEKLLRTTMGVKGLPPEAQTFLDHVMLLRAKEMYLFDYEKNRSVVADDPWLADAWAWIAGAEQAAAESAMLSAPLDLSYMGVASIWLNDLGNKPSTRLVDGGNTLPDTSAWERAIGVMCSRRGLLPFTNLETKKPHHRQLCMDICSWGRSAPSDWLEWEKIPSHEKTTTWHTMTTAHELFKGETQNAVQLLKKASAEHPELMFVSLALQLVSRGDGTLAKEQLDFDEKIASQTDPYLRAISSLIATGDWTTIANQRSLPLRERAYVALRYLTDEQLTQWMKKEVENVVEAGEISGVVLTGITDKTVDLLARYIEKFHDVQTATLITSICAPRYIDDYRCAAWRKSYRAYLQRHKAYFQRTKFDVESTKKSKRRDGIPTIKPPFRQIALRCVFCDAQMAMPRGVGTAASSSSAAVAAAEQNPLTAKLADAGISCPTCKRHLPRCVVCLEIVGLPRSDRPEASSDPEVKLAARFPTFCLKCEHVLHLDHARQWFARHAECPVPECRCQCNFRANSELNYK